MIILPQEQEGLHHQGIAQSSLGYDMVLVKAFASLGRVITALT
jgi:hypothetical protein